MAPVPRRHGGRRGQADIVVTCTPSHEYLLGPDDVPPGTSVAGVGVDNPHKKELHPGLLAAGTVVARNGRGSRLSHDPRHDSR